MVDHEYIPTDWQILSETEAAMNGQHENRRVRMTKRLMKDAMLELLEQRELSDISVTAICETADIHRSTFYKYYTQPSDLMRDIEKDALEQIPVFPPPPDIPGEESLLCATTAFFDYVKENEKVFRILFSESVNAGFSSRMMELLCSRFITGIDNEDELPSHYQKLYIANGTVGMLREWVNSGFPISSRKIAEMMYFLSRKLIEKNKM